MNTDLNKVYEEAIAKGELPKANAIYNRVSIEADIPLDVAKSMARCAGAFQLLAMRMDTDEERNAIISGFEEVWLDLSGPLHIPRERLAVAMKLTFKELIETTRRAMKLARDHMAKQEAAEKKVA